MPPKNKKGKSGAGEASASNSTSETAQQQLYLRQSLQQEKAALSSRLSEQQQDTESLRKAAERSSKETAEFIGYFQKQLEQKDEYINQLRDQLRNMEYESTSEIKRLKEAYEEECRKIRNSSNETIEQLRRDYRNAKEELGRLQEFKLKKADYDAKLEELREELQEEQKARNEEIAEVERKFLLEKKNIEKEHEKEYANLKRKAKKEAQNQLDSGTKRVLFDNKRMSEELAFHQEQTEVLTKEKERLQEENKQYAREVSLFKDKEKEYAKQGQRKQKMINEMRSRVRELETQLEDREQNYEDHSKATEKYTQKKIDSLKAELKDTRAALQRKDEELRKVRRLAEIVVKQRTEVEQFLLEALHDVRKEIAVKKAQAAQLRGSSNKYEDAKRETVRSQLPSIRKAIAASRKKLSDSSRQDSVTSNAARNIAQSGTLEVRMGGSSQPHSLQQNEEESRLLTLLENTDANRVDIKQLTPLEKERVLRILFSKINSHEEGETQLRPHPHSSMSTEEVEQKHDRNFEAGAPFGLSVPLPKELEEPARYNLPSEQSAGQRQATNGREDAGARLLHAIHDSRQQLQQQHQEESYSDDSYAEQNMLPDLA
eukprot:gb/GECG01010913.1/.p1 GENE.gb/GECG01010913.1/~~gb/GECG01010913.1/.p1  ORF type:complete len:601 (+),score=145.37 gb/GECG01010913.1/:1-1803(+)